MTEGQNAANVKQAFSYHDRPYDRYGGTRSNSCVAQASEVDLFPVVLITVQLPSDPLEFVDALHSRLDIVNGALARRDEEAAADELRFQIDQMRRQGWASPPRTA